MSNIEVYRDICRRVYEGRGKLYDMFALDPSGSNVHVVVSETTFARLVSAFRSRLRGEGDREFFDLTFDANTMTIYGMVVEHDPCLTDDEVRFRLEASL